MSPTATCPECSKPASPEHFPFCSARCRLLDLGEWLVGRRGIPATELEDEGSRLETSEEDTPEPS